MRGQVRTSHKRGQVRTSDTGPSGPARTVAPVASPCDCPRCGSDLVQPLRWEADVVHGMLVDLRCPECDQWRQGALSREEVEALDHAQTAARATLVATYERLVAESMEALAVCLAKALDLDLVGADDFAPRRSPGASLPGPA